MKKEQAKKEEVKVAVVEGETTPVETKQVEDKPVEGVKVEVPVAENAKAKKEETTAKAKVKKDTPRTQTTVIQELLRAGKNDEEIIKALAAEIGRDEKWGRGRLSLYQRAYGKRGERDKGMADHDGAVVNAAS